MQDDNPRPDDAISGAQPEALPLASRLPKAMPPVPASARRSAAVAAMPPPNRRRPRKVRPLLRPPRSSRRIPVAASRKPNRRCPIDTADRMEQRLGKYLNSEAVMPKLHKVLADAGIGRAARWKS